MKKQAMDTVLARRRLNIEKAQRLVEIKRAEAFSVAEIKNAHTQYTNEVFNAMRSGKNNSSSASEALDKYRNALKKYGYAESDFEYEPVCAVCKDTGSDNDKLCGCVWKEYVEALKSFCEAETRAPFTFADCDLSVINDVSQREAMAVLYGKMREYAEKFPAVSRANIVISGSVGTGKTCIASAVARTVLEKGCDVRFVSAYEFNAVMLKAHTSPISERAAIMNDVLTADLLVIDDLGTEPMLRNVTVEYLLLTLEERLNKRLATIITTNLGIERISARYGERIYSRLSDKRHSLVIELNGNDLRI